MTPAVLDKSVLKTLTKVKPELITENEITKDAARAEPIWGGHLIEMTPSMMKKKEVWKNIVLQLNKVRRHQRKNR